MAEVEEVTTPIRIEGPRAHESELIRKHASGMLAFGEDVQQAAHAYQQASEALDSKLQGILFDERGRPRLVPDEMQRQRDLVEQERASHLETFRKRLDSLRSIADETIQETTADLLKLTRPALDTLSAPELERAAHRRAFVQEDCTDLLLRELVERIDQTIAGGDRADMALYQRYAQQRHDKDYADDPSARSVAALRAALARLDQALIDPATLAKREKYQAQQRAAELLQQAISNARFAFDPAAIEDRARRWGI